MKTKLLTGSLFAALLLAIIYYFTMSPMQLPNNPKIPANHEFLQFTGRIDFTQAIAPEFSWPGSMIQANFTGTAISIILDDQYGKNYFNVFIDEDWENPVVIKGEKGKKTYPISLALPAGNHSLTLTKRTEGEQGATKFYGLLLADDGQMLPPPERPQRRIEFFGDSITSGWGIEAPDDGPDDKPEEKNNFLAYGAVTARNLKAEYVSTSQSGVGLMASYVAFTMQDYYDQLNAVENNQSQWDFSRWVPHVVVINLFQNDSSLVETRLDPVPTEDERIQVYYDFIKTIRARYPQAFIVSTLGSMDAVKPGSPWPGYIQTAVQRFKTETRDERIEVFFFEYTGFDKHPRVRHHRDNAEALTAFIRAKMAWE